MAIGFYTVKKCFSDKSIYDLDNYYKDWQKKFDTLEEAKQYIEDNLQNLEDKFNAMSILHCYYTQNEDGNFYEDKEKTLLFACYHKEDYI